VCLVCADLAVNENATQTVTDEQWPNVPIHEVHLQARDGPTRVTLLDWAWENATQTVTNEKWPNGPIHQARQLQNHLDSSHVNVLGFTGFLATTFPAGGTTIGYQVVSQSGNAFNAYLLDDTNFQLFLNLSSFQYYTAFSFQNVTQALLQQIYYSNPSQRHLVIYGVGFDAITLWENQGIVTGAQCTYCQPSVGGFCLSGPSCTCNLGWSGTLCNQPLCDNPVCLTNETCTGPNTCTFISSGLVTRSSYVHWIFISLLLFLTKLI